MEQTAKKTNLDSNLLNKITNSISAQVKDIKKRREINNSNLRDDLQNSLRVLEDKVNEARNFKVNDDTPEFLKNHAEDKNETIQDIINRGRKNNVEKEEISNKNGSSNTEIEKDDNQPTQNPNVKLLTKQKIRGLSESLKQRVFGQDETIEEVVDILKVAALNIKINKQKPAGCYLMAGPSGVGKTELAQSIADNLGVPLLKIDMGEYGQEQDVSKLIGTAKGLVGYKEGGLLTNFVKENPACVVLFDELEKADPTIDKIMLSIMDHGTCGANDGTIVSFKETIVISTSNLGAEVEYNTTLSKEEKNKIRMEHIKDGLRPEIINRYDSIFHLNALSHDIYKKVAVKFLTKLSESIKEEHNFNLNFTPKLIDFIVEKSYDPAMGGRPARKFIEKIVIKPLAEYMLNDDFEEVAVQHKEISMDLNKESNIFFKGKNRKILGTLENTAELVSRIEEGKFTNKVKKSI